MGKDLKGRNLGKGISQRKDGRYVGRFTNRFKTRESYINKDLKEVRKWLEEKKAEDQLGLNVKPNTITVNDLYKYWVNNYRVGIVKQNTLQRNDDTYKILKQYLGNMQVTKVTPMYLNTVFKDITPNYCKDTLSHIKSLYNSLFELAKAMEIIKENPFNKYTVIYAKAKNGDKEKAITKEDYFDETEEAFFLAVLKDINSKYYDLFEFLLNTGLRIGECLALEYDDIKINPKNKENVFISISRTKTTQKDEYGNPIFNTPKTAKSIRKIPLNKAARKALFSQIEKKEKIYRKKEVCKKYRTYIFTNELGYSIEYTNIQQHLKRVNSEIEKYFVDYKFPYVHCHLMRHTFASKCFNADIDPKVVQTLLGHKSIQTTMDIYTHVISNKLQQQIKSYDDYLKYRKKNNKVNTDYLNDTIQEQEQLQYSIGDILDNLKNGIKIVSN